MKRPTGLKLLSLLIPACALITGCGQPADQSEAARRSIEEVADEYLEAMIERFPEMATSYSLPGRSHDELFDNSPEARATWQAREDAWLRELEDIGAPGDIGSRDWVTFGILHEQLAGSIATRSCRSELWAAADITAWHTSLPQVFELQPLETPELRDQAVARLGKVAGYLEREVENLRRGLELGYSAPRVTALNVPGEVRSLLESENPFLGMAARSDDPVFGQAVAKVFNESTRPAIEHFADFMENEYLPAAREEIALSAHPDGDACYPLLVRSFATISPAADEIHRIGLEQIATVRAEMQTLVDEHFGGGEIESFLQSLNLDPRFTFRTEAEVLEYSVEALDAARDTMPEAFGRLPRAEVLIEPYPPHRASGTGEYVYSSEDGSRPGIYFIAVVRPENRSRAIQQSVLYHETYPGHHLQGAIALELGDRVHPLARYTWNSGYVEGWGLYSERLADELGLYSGPLDRMGMLSDQAARAARLVVDSGLHTKGWTREQAVDFMLSNTAWPPGDIESEINRYIAWPGQATSYMLGMLEIRRLRSLAENSLQGDFELRAFHDRVLGSGSITLPMLAASVSAWIEEVDL